MSKNIIDYPITDSIFITVFSERKSNTISLSRSGTVVFNGNYVDTEFSNNKKSFRNHELLGCLGTPVFEKKAKKFLDSIKYDYDSSAEQALLEYLNGQGYPFSEDCNIWIIIPKSDKKPTGDKFTNIFDGLPTEDYKKNATQNLELTVYMTKIDSNTKRILFRVDIPDYIYNKCMENPDIENRLSLKYIESENLSTLHSEMSDYANKACHVHDLLTSSEKNKKKIGVVFDSGNSLERDSFNFAYLGKRTNITFRWYIVYEYEKSSFFSNEKCYFTWKKNMGAGTTIGAFREYKGVVDFENKGIKSHLSSKPQGVLLDWTQEREDFLIALEEKFRNLSSNLNEFLSDLDNQKIDNLISSSSVTKFLNS